MGITLKGFVRVTKTTSGKTGIGLEVQVAGMNRYSDLSKVQQEWFKSNGFRWMKALYEEKDSKWVKTRDGFFYRGFETKKDRDAMAKRLEAKLVKAEKPAKAKAEKPAKAKAEKPAKPLDKMTKKELIALLEAAIG